MRPGRIAANFPRRPSRAVQRPSCMVTAEDDSNTGATETPRSTDDCKARNAHLRRKLRVNIQSYLEKAGIAPATAAAMATDLNHDV